MIAFQSLILVPQGSVGDEYRKLGIKASNINHLKREHWWIR